MDWYIEWTKESSWDVQHRNVALPEKFLEEENIDFLRGMMGDDIDNYKIVAYIGSGYSDIKNLEGIIANESTGRFIIFDGWDAFPKQNNLENDTTEQ